VAGGWDERLLATTGRGLRAMARRLQTTRENIGPVAKFVRAMLFVPLFALWLAPLRVRAFWRGSIRVRATTDTGTTFDCRPPDLIQMYLFLFGMWEPDLTSYLRRHLKPGRTFIDVGANIGYFSLEASRLVGADGKVVAIEAAPWICELLEGHLKSNATPGPVRTVNRAVSDRVHEIELYAGPDKNVGLTTTVQSRGMRHRGAVAAAPLGDLLEPEDVSTAQIIKIDVEGAEVAVLEGMRPLLANLPADVEFLIELSPAWWEDTSRTPDEVLQPYYDAGFRAHEMQNSYWPWRYLWPRCATAPVPARRPLPANVKRIDLLLTRSEINPG
jgi:FkbM family methyltransferase